MAGFERVLVTGGTRGIGRATALRLAQGGARLLILNHVENDEAARRTRDEVAALGAECRIVKANLAQPGEIDRLFEDVRAATDRLDGFVHCAAISAFKPLLEIKANQWDLTVNVNARSFLLCAQHCAPRMNGGAVVAVSSLGGARVVPNYGAMGPTKAALESMVRYLAVELAGRSTRVNGVAAGLVQTDVLDKMPNAAAVADAFASKSPGGRVGTPEDVAETIVFLLSPASRWINGQTIVVDGGYSIVS